MSKKVTLKVRQDSAYGVVTAWMRKVQVYTKSQVIEQFKGLGKGDKAALASAVVLLSPRLTSKRGSFLGNRSNPWGHIAYNEPLTKTAGVERKFRFRIRKVEIVTKSEKTPKTYATTKHAEKAIVA